MAKIKDVIKKIAVTILLFFTSIYTKVLAYTNQNFNDYAEQYFRTGEIVDMYGVPKPTYMTIWEYARITIIPIAFIIGAIAFIIGAIVYLKKSAKDTKNKIKTLLIALAVVLIVVFTISLIIEFYENF